jgi:hypothetical protein
LYGRKGREGKGGNFTLPEINKMIYKTKSQKIAIALMIIIPCTQSGAL